MTATSDPSHNLRSGRLALGAWALVFGGAVTLGVITPSLLDWLGDARNVSAAVVLTGFAIAGLAGTRMMQRDWFHPLALPMLYVSAACLLPLAYIDLTGASIGSLTFDALTVPFHLVFLLTVALFAAGILAGFQLVRPLSTLPPVRATAWRRALVLARLTLAAAVLLRAADFLRSYGAAYGTDAVSFGLDSLLETAASIGALGGIAVLAVSSIHVSQRVMGRLEAGLLAAFALLTLGTGGRGDLIAPLLFLLLMHHSYVRPLPRSSLAAGLLCLLLAFQGVAGTRAEEGLVTDASGIRDRLLVGLSVPAQVQGLLMRYVPDSEPYRHGSTYLAAMERQLPGPLAVAVLGPPADTATFELRQMLGFTNPNAGFGFSLPAEAFLNFGLTGVAGVAFLVGLLFTASFRRSPHPLEGALPDRARHLLYPLLVATLPLSLRADAVQQIKTVLYPMIFTALVLVLVRKRARVTHHS